MQSSTHLTKANYKPVVKFCGFTNAHQLQQAIELGVDAVGFVLYEKSPRAVSAAQANILANTVPPFVTIVALVVNMPEQELVYLAHHMPFDIIQFHGDESAQLCQLMANRIGKRWIKALRVNIDDTAQILLDKINELKQFGACGVLLDAYQPDKFGGTGERFDWGKIPKDSPLPIILAGGLTADNVGKAIATTNVYGVDVSGGIESAKGVKSLEKMQDFMKEVKDY